MLFDRKVKLIFDGAKINPIEKLRVAFEIDKADGAQMNHAIIRIYNLNPSSRSALARVIHPDTEIAEPVITCHLSAGYQGNLKHLMSGDIITATNQRVGPDWITEIETYTGMAASTNGSVSLSYDGKTSAKQITDDLLGPLKLDVRFSPAAKQMLSEQSVTDYSNSGLSYYLITEFLERYKFGFTIEDNNQGLVYALKEPREAASLSNNDNTFSIENGLIGSPKVTRTGVVFQSLLRPSIQLLQRVFVKSQTISETLQNQNVYTNEYYVKGIKHIGDTHSDEWYTEIEGAYVGLNEGELGGR